MIYINYFTENIRIEDLLNPLIKENIIEEDFKKFVIEEYGEPWVKGYPIDSEILIEALSLWTGLDGEEIANYMSYIIANLASSYTEFKNDIYRLFIGGSSTSLNLKPIDKKYKNIKFIKNSIKGM